MRWRSTGSPVSRGTLTSYYEARRSSSRIHHFVSVGWTVVTPKGVVVDRHPRSILDIPRRRAACGAKVHRGALNDESAPDCQRCLGTVAWKQAVPL